MIGDTVGKYRIVATLGRGGMGTVYRAVDETLGRDVAIKSLNPDVTDASLLRRFRAEAVALAHLNHPNIATLFELTEHEGQLLMIMEFVRGETLDRLAQQSGGMPIERASRLTVQVLDALGHAHRSGIVHRDLKPANLMLTDSGLVKVMDFGLARMVGTEHLTNDGFMVGTPAYMSPEQVLGREIDGRTDLYATGVVLYRLLTGQLPFTAESGIAMVQKQINEVPTPLRQVRPDLPDAVQDVIIRALAKSADDRYQTADEFKIALMPFVGNLSAVDMPLPSGIVAALSGVSRLNDAALAAAGAKATIVETPPPPAPPPRAADPQPATKLLPRGNAGSHSATSRRAAAIGGAVGLLLLVGVPAGIMIVRRGAPPAVGSGRSAVLAPSPLSTSGSLARNAAIAGDATPASGPMASPAAAREAIEADAPSVPRAESPDAKTSLAGSRSKLPVVTFDQVKLLEIDPNGKLHDRDAALRLGGDRVDLLDGATALQSVRYADLVGVFHSHSREPRWTNPDGTTILVARVGGPFGFLKGADDWITLRTKKSFVAVRVQPDELTRVLSELQARTGRPVVQAR